MHNPAATPTTPQVRRVLPAAGGRVVAAVAAGGALGALARHGAAVAWPQPSGAFPWTTFAVNVVGCLAIGALLVGVTEARRPPHPLARPFLGTGVLGGFTTFSAYAVEAQDLLAAGEAGTAAAYLAGTLLAALAAAQVGVWLARAALARAAAATRRGGRHPAGAPSAAPKERRQS